LGSPKKKNVGLSNRSVHRRRRTEKQECSLPGEKGGSFLKQQSAAVSNGLSVGAKRKSKRGKDHDRTGKLSRIQGSDHEQKKRKGMGLEEHQKGSNEKREKETRCLRNHTGDSDSVRGGALPPRTLQKNHGQKRTQKITILHPLEKKKVPKKRHRNKKKSRRKKFGPVVKGKTNLKEKKLFEKISTRTKKSSSSLGRGSFAPTKQYNFETLLREARAMRQRGGETKSHGRKKKAHAKPKAERRTF